MTQSSQNKLLPNLSAGVIIGLLQIFMALSFAALIFSGALSSYVSQGIGLALMGTIITGLVIAAFTSLPGTIGGSQGQPADTLYFLAAGKVTARLNMPDGSFVRLETMGGCGRVIGEVGFFLGGERTADVVADEPSTLFRLTRDYLARMQNENPQAASILHRLTANILAERVMRLTRSVNALER